MSVFDDEAVDTAPVGRKADTCTDDLARICLEFKTVVHVMNLPERFFGRFIAFEFEKKYIWCPVLITISMLPLEFFFLDVDIETDQVVSRRHKQLLDRCRPIDVYRVLCSYFLKVMNPDRIFQSVHLR